MKEEASYLEKLGINTLLWLEKYVEKKPLDVSRIETDTTRGRMRYIPYTISLLIGLSLLYRVTQEQNSQRIESNPTTPSVTGQGMEFSPSSNWKFQPEVQNRLSKARENGYTILDTGNWVFSNNFIFLNNSPDFILVENIEAFVRLRSNTNPEPIKNPNQILGFIFTTIGDDKSQFFGVSTYRLHLDNHSVQTMTEITPTQFMTRLSEGISATIATVLDDAAQLGPEKTFQILSSTNPEDNQVKEAKIANYRSLFAAGKLPLPIIVIGMSNPSVNQQLHAQRP